MKKRNMKKILVILFFSSAIQCGRPCPSDSWKKHNYKAERHRFALQTSPKEIKLHTLEACKKLVCDLEKLMSDIEQDYIMQTDQLMIEHFDILLRKFTRYGGLLQSRLYNLHY